MEIIKKILGIVFWSVLSFIALYSTVIIVQKLLYRDRTPSFFGYKNFIVLTGSMEPTLRMGDIVIVKETTNIKKDDVIAFREKNSVVTHRVFEIHKENDREFYVTKGDANSDVDLGLVAKEDIEGKYCFKIPFLGLIILFIQKPIGIITLFVTLGLFLLVTSIMPDKDQEI